MFVQEQLSPPWVCDNVLGDLRSQQRLCVTSHDCERGTGAASILPTAGAKARSGSGGVCNPGSLQDRSESTKLVSPAGCKLRMEWRGGSRAPLGLDAKCCANCKARLK